MGYPRLAERLYNTPLLMTFEKAEVIEAVFRAHAEGRVNELPKYEDTMRDHMAGSISLRKTDGGYYVSNSGVAVVPVHGSLVQRAGGMDAASGMTGYNMLASRISAAARDPQVRGMVLEVDSPGGEVAGVFELASLISSLELPVWAHANEFAASAAYLIGSSATKLYAPQTGLVGSVGVVMLHVDRSKQAEKAGLTYTPIFAGARKLDGSGMAPLSEEARASAQARVDALYTLFVDTVAKSRGIKASAVRGTEAAVMSIQDATALGMADGVATLGDVIQSMTDDLNAGTFTRSPLRSRAEVGAITPGESTMTEKTNPAAANAADAPKPDAVATAAAVPAAPANAAAPAQPDAQATERARISGILTHAEADGRTALAQHLAFNTTSSVNDAAAILAASAKAAAPAQTNALATAMAQVPNPNVGADGKPAAAPGTTAVQLNHSSIYNSRKLVAVK
jgi:capsid assembly protease